MAHFFEDGAPCFCPLWEFFIENKPLHGIIGDFNRVPFPLMQHELSIIAVIDPASS